MFPGYIFVEMIVTDESWFIVRNTPKVTGFLGSSGNGTKPVPLPPEEVANVFKKAGIVPQINIDFEVGDMVEIVSGSMAGKIVEVTDIAIRRKPLQSGYVVSKADILISQYRMDEARAELNAAIKRGIPRYALKEWLDKCRH